MPMLNTSVVTHRVAQLGKGRDALVVIAEQTDIPAGTLRNAVGGRQPLSLARVYTLAEALGMEVREILANSDDVPELPPHQGGIEPITVLGQGQTNDGVPDEPPAQPTGPKGSPKRKDTTTRKTGPKRTSRSAA